MDISELRSQLERHQQESYGWALGCCSRDRAEAENVLQIAYLKILEGRARFEGKSAFKTWLFSVIRKTAADARRQRFLQRLRLGGYAESATRGAREEDPSETLYRTEVQTMFRRSLAALPRRQAEVLQLVFYHDLSLAEAAEVMCVSLGSARTHYERGKKRLRRLLTESGVFDEQGYARERTRAAVRRTEAGG